MDARSEGDPEEQERGHGPRAGPQDSPDGLGPAGKASRDQEEPEGQCGEQGQAGAGNEPTPRLRGATIERQQRNPAQSQRHATELAAAGSLPERQPDENRNHRPGGSNRRDHADHPDRHAAVDRRQSDQPDQAGQHSGRNPGSGAEGDPTQDDDGRDQDQRWWLRDEQHREGSQASGLNAADEIADAPAQAGRERQQNGRQFETRRTVALTARSPSRCRRPRRSSKTASMGQTTTSPPITLRRAARHQPGTPPSGPYTEMPIRSLPRV